MSTEKRFLNLTWQDPTSGDSKVRDYPLPVTLGRDKGNSVVLPGGGISRQHCEIRVEGSDVLVKDLGSSNGTFVNGNQITETILGEGDELTIGDIVLTVSFSTSRRATSMENLFDALTEGEAEATITLKSLKTKDLFADLDSQKDSKPIEQSSIQTTELPSRDTLSGAELKDFLSHGLQDDIDKDISPDIDKMTADVRQEHMQAMQKLQNEADAKNAEPEGALGKFMASLRRLFGG